MAKGIQFTAVILGMLIAASQAGAQIEPYAQSEAFTLDTAIRIADSDGDGLNNLTEYALGGNSADPQDRGTLPVLAKSAGGLAYVHPQRSDDSSLIYRVETATNLVSGIWTNAGYTITGTNVTGHTLDYVTNAVDTAAGVRFIRLNIE